MDFVKELKLNAEKIDGLISQALPSEAGLQKRLIEAMNYSIMSGGKRIRPILLLESYNLFGKVVEPFLVSIELIHSFSLVHDDLPSMDYSELRRGRKSTHCAYGEAMALLAGDAMLNYAYEVAFSAFGMGYDRQVIRALRTLSNKTGLYGMGGGQAVEIENNDDQIGIETIHFINENKCGALIEAALMIGAELAGATDDYVVIMENIGSCIGRAFQIQDDILDLTGNSIKLGKPTGIDTKNNKCTYASLVGIEEAKDMVCNLFYEALEKLDDLPYRNNFLKSLIQYLIDREF
jgi:geranylgeranyl diphosphate synthase type II